MSTKRKTKTKTKTKRKLGNIEVLESTCNLSTLKDGRGAILTWVPDLPILEFNMLYFHPNKIRGNHFHAEFTEFFLVISGSIMMVTRDKEAEEVSMQASAGVCFKTPPNTAHAVHAITDSICVSMLTKPWDTCDRPIIHEDLIGFNQEYIDYMKELDPDYDPSKNTGL
jgi:dTDP-4-dehydrorhamnose 3,5-epimerase-like enzyme